MHEAYLRLVNRQRVDWCGKAHFLAAAAQVMRHILVDHARAKRAQKRGAEAAQVTLAGAGDQTPGQSVEVLAVDLALAQRLAPADRARFVAAACGE